jgi:hypothetical protein
MASKQLIATTLSSTTRRALRTCAWPPSLMTPSSCTMTTPSSRTSKPSSRSTCLLQSRTCHICVVSELFTTLSMASSRSISRSTSKPRPSNLAGPMAAAASVRLCHQLLSTQHHHQSLTQPKLKDRVYSFHDSDTR